MGDTASESASESAVTGSESNPTSPSTNPDSPTAKAKSDPAVDTSGFDEAAKDAKAKPVSAPPKSKKLSPRQRRRKWLVSVLKNLSGKRLDASKLSSFQIVMLARALRSGVAECSFEYDANKFVAELQNAAGSIHRGHSDRLRDIVLQNEGVIRDAGETAWWDDLQERASARLVTLTSDQLRQQIDRGGVEASVVLAIDAVGPKSAAATVVSSDGDVLHTEDLPSGLGKGPRTAAMTRMGELVHTYRADLIVISNGLARRAMMVAVAELIKQSPPGSIRYTLAERSGADAYAGSSMADGEMPTTPRRFRAAAWLAFSILHPAQALAKIDPLKLRLNAFSRELNDSALRETLDDVLVSGASRGGIDVNTAPVSWLARLPGMDHETAKTIDRRRRESLFKSRDEIESDDVLEGPSSRRQALPFLRVFHSDETLDGTLIHPDDYPLAKKLAGSLEIELPPEAPPGYTLPDYSVASPAAPASGKADVALKDAPKPDAGVSVEDFTVSQKPEQDFKVGESDDAASASGVAGASEDAEASEDAGSTTSNLDAAESDPTATASSEPTAGETSTSEPAAEPSETDSQDQSAESADAEDSGASGSSNSDATDSSDAGDDSAAGDAGASEPDPTLAAVRRPKPESTKVDKCVKEWQIGTRRAHQIVDWLCDPFGDGNSDGNPPAVCQTIPSLSNLKAGDEVVGIVVGMMPFGVFVELAPDCSGLVHISRLAETYVEDMHEVVSIGDIVSAYVEGIDDKHRRVSLSLVSPQRLEELEQERREKRQRGSNFGPRGRGGPGRGGPGRNQNSAGHSSSGQAGSGRGNAGRGDGPRGGSTGGGQARGGSGRGGPNRGDGPPARGGRNDRGGGRNDRGGGRNDRGGNRGSRSRDGRRDNRGGRSRSVESYRVEGKKEHKPITEEMRAGAEPMRSFGDLAQFMTVDTTPETPSETPATKSEASTDAKPDANNDARQDQGDAATPSSDSPSTHPPTADPPSVDPVADSGANDRSGSTDASTDASDSAGPSEPGVVDKPSADAS